MLTLEPETLTIKPRKTYQLSQGYPHARLVNAMPWLEISGSAKTDISTISADVWQEWECLADFGISHYVVRNTSQPKFGVIRAAKGGQDYGDTTANFQIVGDNLIWNTDDDYPPLSDTVFSVSGYDLYVQSSAEFNRIDDNVFLKASEKGLYTVNFSFEAKPNSITTYNTTDNTDAHFEIIGEDLWWFPDTENNYPPLMGTTFSLSGGNLMANTTANLYLTGDAVFVDGFGAGYRLPCPNIDDFTHEPVERRITQQFDSGRTRRNTKAAGVLHNLSCSFNMNIAEARAWLSYYLRVLPDYIEADWLDNYFGGTKRLHLAAEPWELSASGTQFTLKINGMVVDG
jgi:hypothetical protein